jgi:hypothetical protein
MSERGVWISRVLVARDAITPTDGMVEIKIYFLMVLKTKSSRSKCWYVWFFLRCLLPLTYRCVSSCCVFKCLSSVHLQLCSKLPPLINHIGIKSILMVSFYPNSKALSSNTTTLSYSELGA